MSVDEFSHENEIILWLKLRKNPVHLLWQAARQTLWESERAQREESSSAGLASPSAGHTQYVSWWGGCIGECARPRRVEISFHLCTPISRVSQSTRTACLPLFRRGALHLWGASPSLSRRVTSNFPPSCLSKLRLLDRSGGGRIDEGRNYRDPESL